MSDLDIQTDLMDRLRAIAERENRPLDDLVADLLALYDARQMSAVDTLDAMDGMFEDDITDLSATVRDTMRAYYTHKHEHPG